MNDDSLCRVVMDYPVDLPRSDGDARFCCGPAMFALQMQHFADDGWYVTAPSDFVTTRHARREPPDNGIGITFYDGTVRTRENAVPVPERHGFPARVVVVSGRLAGRNEWVPGASESVCTMLDAPQLREQVAAGIEVGSHGVSHVRLARVPLVVAIDQLHRSRVELQVCSTRWAPKGADANPFAIYSGSRDMPPWSVPRVAAECALHGLGIKPGGALP